MHIGERYDQDVEFENEEDKKEPEDSEHRISESSMTGREEESKEEIGPRKNHDLIYKTRKSSKDLKPVQLSKPKR